MIRRAQLLFGTCSFFGASAVPEHALMPILVRFFEGFRFGPVRSRFVQIPFSTTTCRGWVAQISCLALPSARLTPEKNGPDFSSVMDSGFQVLRLGLRSGFGAVEVIGAWSFEVAIRV